MCVLDTSLDIKGKILYWSADEMFEDISISDRSLRILRSRPIVKYCEGRIKDYNEQTGEMYLELIGVSSNGKWLQFWRENNWQWAKRLHFRFLYVD